MHIPTYIQIYTYICIDKILKQYSNPYTHIHTFKYMHTNLNCLDLMTCNDWHTD